LAGDLLNLDDHELGGFEGRKANDDIDYAAIDVVLRGGFTIALDEIGFLWSFSLKCALAKKILHEGADVQPNLRP